jgi:hypothetical protein
MEKSIERMLNNAGFTVDHLQSTLPLKCGELISLYHLGLGIMLMIR